MIGRGSPVLSAPETRDNTLIDLMLFRALRFPPAIRRVSLGFRGSIVNGAKRREKHAPDSHGFSQIITAGETRDSRKAKLRLDLCTRSFGRGHMRHRHRDLKGLSGVHRQFGELRNVTNEPNAKQVAGNRKLF